MKISLMLGLIACACTAIGCSQAQGHEARPARPVKAQAVVAAPPPTGIRYSATIDASEQMPLAFKASGYVNDVLQRTGADGKPRAAQAGDLVPKGAVLAHVDEADYRQRVEQGRARLAEGEAVLTKARLDLDRARTLFAADSLTKPDLDGAQASFDTAQARVAATKADIELAANALRDTALVSPSGGVLLERRIEIGSLVGAGTVAFLFADVSAVKARFGIPDSVIHSIASGDRIDVTVDSVASTAFAGRVTKIAPAADPSSRVFDVEVTIPNKDGRLRPGMIGTVTVGQDPEAATARAPQPPTLPLSAVIRMPNDTEQYAVFVVERQGDADVVHLRRVELGDVVGNGVAASSGVALGDRVVTSGATLLTDGDQVRVIP